MEPVQHKHLLLDALRLGAPDPWRPLGSYCSVGRWRDEVTALKRGVKKSSAFKTQFGDPEQQNGRHRSVECAAAH